MSSFSPSVSAGTVEQSSFGDHSAAVPCLICRTLTRPWLTVSGDWRSPAVSDVFQLVWCDRCAFGFATPRPTLEELAVYYEIENYYTHEAPQRVDAVRTLADRIRVHLAWRADHRREEEIMPTNVERYGVRPPAKLCDIGCGNGGLMRRMAAAGFDVVGIDPDAAACRVAMAAGLRVVRGSAEDIPGELAGERFDCITMTHVLEHTLDPEAALGNIADLLKCGGTFVVVTPNNACLGLRKAGVTWRWLDVPRHVNFFTPQSLCAVCRRAGLEIVNVEFNGYVRQFQHDWIAEEQEIHRRFTALSADRPGCSPLPPRNNPWRAAWLLARTCFAADEAKYDSVRVVARKR